MIKIAFMGDITPGGVMTLSGGISTDVIDYLSNFDFRIATLESCFGEGLSFCKIKMNDSRMGNCIYSLDESISILRELNIDAVSLANNHACDCGIDGLYRTIEILEKNNIQHFGAGHNLKQASKPLILNKNGKTISLLAYNTIAWASYKATERNGGMNWFEIDSVLKDVSHYQELYDYVIVMPHWGIEQTIWPVFYPDVLYAHKIIKAGASAIIGSHTHIVQPIVRYNGGIIAMSLGNFIFPDRYINKPRNTYYPTQFELNNENIPHTNGFPFVDTLTYKHAPEKGRTGVICSIELGKEMSYKRKYTYLTEEHFLILKNERVIHKLKLFMVGLCVKDDRLILYKIVYIHKLIFNKLKSILKNK